MMMSIEAFSTRPIAVRLMRFGSIVRNLGLEQPGDFIFSWSRGSSQQLHCCLAYKCFSKTSEDASALIVFSTCRIRSDLVLSRHF